MATAAHLRKKKAADAESGEAAVDEPSGDCPHEADAPKQRWSAEATAHAVYFKLFVTARCFLGY